MLNPRLANRYAKSLLDLANEKGQLEQIYKDMEWLNSVIRSSREFVAVLRSPVIKGDKKTKILEAVTGGHLSEMTTMFIRLLIGKNRESFLPEIATAFLQQYKDQKGIRTVKLTTASEISEETKKAILDQLKKSKDMDKVELETAVNSDLIGGFVLQAGDQLIDASVAYDLRAIARQFENNDFIHRIR